MYLHTVGRDAAAAIDVSQEQPGLVERLYREHVARNVRIAYLLTGDLEAARDLVHDAFVRTSGRLHTLRNPDAFGAYLTRTVINLSKRHRERGALERRFLERRFLERERATATPNAMQPDIATRDQLLTALRGLPHRQRAALVLRYYEDLSEADIADVLGCALGTVKSLLSRGLAGLRARVGEEP